MLALKRQSITDVLCPQGESPLFTDIDVNVYVGDITANDGIPTFTKPAFDEQAFVLEVNKRALSSPFIWMV